MRRHSFAFALAATSVAIASPASSAIIVYTASLSGSQEVPAVASPGTGFATVTIDTVLNTMRVQTTFSGLLGNTTASHIHCCSAFGTNAGVATVTPTFTGFPLGVTSGTYDSTFDMTLASSFNPAFVTANGGTVASARAALFAGIAAGQSYLNIHSSQFASGEIRGQLTAVPEPTTWAFMVVGFGVLGSALRVRRSAVRASA